VLEALFALALLTVTDPSGDAVGAGDLSPPTHAIYRSLSPFDLHSLTITEAETLDLVVEMGSLANPLDLPLGFSLPVIEIYVEGEEGLGEELLPGSGMRLPDGVNWEIAVRLTGDSATAYRLTEAGEEAVSPQVSVEGNSIIVSTPFPRPERPRIFAMVGQYDFFGEEPWRQLEEGQSPWGFHSTGAQFLPVLDVLAEDQAAQDQALLTGILPPAGSRGSSQGQLWLALMLGGVGVALVGVALRVTARRPSPPDLLEGEAAPEEPGEQDEEAAATDADAPDEAPAPEEEQAEEPLTEPSPSPEARGAGADDEEPASDDPGTFISPDIRHDEWTSTWKAKDGDANEAVAGEPEPSDEEVSADDEGDIPDDRSDPADGQEPAADEKKE